MNKENDMRRLEKELLIPLLESIKSLGNEVSVAVYNSTIEIFGSMIGSRRRKETPVFKFYIPEDYESYKPKIEKILEDAWYVGYKIEEYLEDSKTPITDLIEIMRVYRLDDAFLVKLIPYMSQ